jgi:hypothetical protein
MIAFLLLLPLLTEAEARKLFNDSKSKLSPKRLFFKNYTGDNFYIVDKSIFIRKRQLLGFELRLCLINSAHPIVLTY